MSAGLPGTDGFLAAVPEILKYVEAGGFVVIPIEILALVLWAFIVMRFFALRRGTRAAVAGLATMPADRERAKRLSEYGVLSSAVREIAAAISEKGSLNEYTLSVIMFDREEALTRYRRGIAIIVVLAPLLGLLGTVTGMIETFDSLTSLASASDGGVAGGISEALITTQLGLGVAIPGVLAARLLERREQKLRIELNRLRELVAGKSADNVETVTK